MPKGGESRTSLTASSIISARIRWAINQIRASWGSLAGSLSIPSPLLSRFKASSTCQRRRYVSRTTSAVIADDGGEVRTIMNPAAAIVVGCMV